MTTRKRGVDLGLTEQQAIDRARSMAGVAGAGIRYRLNYPNGGDDPTRAIPAADNGGVQVCDCVGFACWCLGIDRYDPGQSVKEDTADATEFHTYGGYVNTDAIIIDASGPRQKFEFIDRPHPGCLVVYGSVDRGKPGGRVGHVGVVVGVPAEWDPSVSDCWRRLEVIDCASRSGRAILKNPNGGMTWFGNDRKGRPKNARFVTLRKDRVRE